jgi:hypothetical protein
MKSKSALNIKDLTFLKDFELLSGRILWEVTQLMNLPWNIINLPLIRVE